MFERFIGKNKQNRPKTYIVAYSLQEVLTSGKKYFRASSKHVFIQRGWLIGNDLYLKNPKRKGQHKVWVASYTA